MLLQYLLGVSYIACTKHMKWKLTCMKLIWFWSWVIAATIRCLLRKLLGPVLGIKLDVSATTDSSLFGSSSDDTECCPSISIESDSMVPETSRCVYGRQARKERRCQKRREVEQVGGRLDWKTSGPSLWKKKKRGG